MVYFIQGTDSGRVKIGATVNVPTRLGELQTGSPKKLKVLAVIESETERSADRKYHPRFASSRIHGEWFNPSPDLMAFIGTVPKSRYDGLSLDTLDVFEKKGYVCARENSRNAENRERLAAIHFGWDPLPNEQGRNPRNEATGRFIAAVGGTDVCANTN